ncbi:MAG: hypothetical protein ABI622_07775, partial [Chloroflexota bacterium]
MFWVILAILVAAVVLISLNAVPALAGIGLLLVAVIVAVAVSDRRDAARRSSAEHVARAMDAGIDNVQRAERRWNLPGGG